MARTPATPKIDEEPKTLGEQLDRMPLDAPNQPQQITLPSATWAGGPALKLGVYQAISMITAELGEIGIAKERQATEGGKFKYRGIDQVYEALNGLLVKHRLVILPRYRDRVETERRTSGGKAMYDVTLTGEFTLICTLDGSSTTVTTYGEAFDLGDKATNKAMSVAYKYAAFQVFCIPVEGENTDDTDADQNHDMVPSRQTAQPAPQQSKEEMEKIARANYDEAIRLIQAAATVAELDQGGPVEKKIKWNLIPKGWHPRIMKAREEHIEAISRPPARPAFEPNFGDLADDIPF